MPRRNIVWILAITCVSLVCIHAAGSNRQDRNEPYELFRLFVDAFEHVERSYVRPVDRRKLLEGAIQGMLQDLDPYSSYIPPRDFRYFERTVKAEFGGIGVEITIKNGRLTVISPLVGTPAYKAGVQAGDWITAIEGKSTEGITIEKAVDQLTGEVGTKVTITVLHEGETKPVDITITRATIHVDSVLGDTRNPDHTWNYLYNGPGSKVGYIRITTFVKDTADELRRAIEQVRQAGGRSLILDLRGNPGGLLRAAIDVSDLFLEEGVIVSTEGRNAKKQVYHATREGTIRDLPLAVLVNKYSASASEIVAAALQDHRRAVVIGERTWGKGSVQNIIELPDDSALKLTTASYIRPNGHNIHRFPDSKDEDEWGVKPTPGFEVELKPEQMRELWENRRQRDVIPPTRAANGSAASQPARVPDVALERAWGYLQDVLAGRQPWPPATAPASQPRKG